MTTVLVNAYACAPHVGSEPGMGWNWILAMAKHCRLHVITEGQWQKEIEAALPDIPQGKNITFHYNPVPDEVRTMCWNQGDWRFYYYYKRWQVSTLALAREIMKHERIDIIHQLNMIGFREPGFLYQIPSIPLVLGPIGGMQLFPLEYLSGASMTTKLFFRLKNAITRYQIKHAPRFIKALAKADTVICSTNVESRSIEWFGHPRVVVIPETSCMILPGTDAINTNRHRQKSFKILWVGKFDYRKQLHLALQVVARSRDLDGISLHVLGTGNQQQQDDYKQMATELRIDHLVTWHGSVPYATVLDMMKEAQLLLFTSVSEATSTVVMDALSCLLPVLCFNTSGMGTVITPSVGVKVELFTPGQSVGDFASHIGRLHANRELLDTMSANCRTRRQELSWDEKAQTLKTLYNQVLSRNQQPGHHDAR